MDSLVIVKKRDGSEEEFSEEKLSAAIMRAAVEVGGDDYSLADELANDIHCYVEENYTSIDAGLLQDIVGDFLIDSGHSRTAKAYIIYANERDKVRNMNTQLMKTFEEITFNDERESDVKRENANIDSSTAMGTMLKYGSEAAKAFNKMYLISPDISKAHTRGDIHIHDLDFFSLTQTCCQLPLDKLFSHPFNTGHGFLRTPGNIRTASALAAIVIQSNQNDQHGGQSIPMFDYYLAPYVSMSHVKNVCHVYAIKYDIDNEKKLALRRKLLNINKELKLVLNDKGTKRIKRCLYNFSKENGVDITDKELTNVLKLAFVDTYDDTYQAMEAFIHNLNTMHSRAGAQVPFSSINYGTDTSTEGRMIMETLLINTERGIGLGETPIFPIQIFKLREGTSFNDDDPNADLFDLACKVSAKRLYPNFCNLDAPFNKAIYVEGHPETEVAYMGCRTRVATNIHNPAAQIVPGRGNLSFTSINLPRLALRSGKNRKRFFKYLDESLELVHRQLLERFECQCRKHPRNYPFLMGQGIWLGTEHLGPDDDIREALKNGTLTVGFIGLAECLVALTGKHHGESEKSQKLGLQIIKHMRDYTDAWSKEEHMNYSVIGTPAEGLSGRFVRLDREIFGRIPGVTDRDYYTNSSHVPVYYPISAFKKIDIEAPYHELENGGHILYIELNGDPTKNVKAFKKIVRYMHDKGAGYMSINHPVDRDPICGYVGIIDDVCPRCGRKDGEPMSSEMYSRIKGFANVGNADTLGYNGSILEEKDRIPNFIEADMDE